jgi:hypothetical protein
MPSAPLKREIRLLIADVKAIVSIHAGCQLQPTPDSRIFEKRFRKRPWLSVLDVGARRGSNSADSHKFNNGKNWSDKMANWVDYQLDVLASCPDEINRIETRLAHPSEELIAWVAEEWHASPKFVTELVTFKSKHNLFQLHESVNKARQFRNSWKRYRGIVNSHLFEVSAEFGTAVFLLEEWDMQTSYSGRMVIHAGKVVQDVFDGKQRSQALDWVLPDIFAPFRAEWNEGLEFGSLWRDWVEETAVAVEELRKSTQEREAERKAAAKAKFEAETDEWLATLWGPSGPSPLGTKPPPFEDVEE